MDHSWGEGLGVQGFDRGSKQKIPSSFPPFQHPSHSQVVQYLHHHLHRTQLCIQISIPTLINYPIRDAVFSGLVVFLNGVELYRSPLPTLVHRSALRYRQTLSAQQITLH